MRENLSQCNHRNRDLLLLFQTRHDVLLQRFDPIRTLPILHLHSVSPIDRGYDLQQVYWLNFATAFDVSFSYKTSNVTVATFPQLKTAFMALVACQQLQAVKNCLL